MKIGTKDTTRKVFTIAEIGNNHEGSYSLAEEMVGKAAEAGADAVKFQTIVPGKLVPPDQQDRLLQLKKLCLTYYDFEKLSAVAKQENILFLSTPFDLESAAFLEPLVPAFKISSGDNRFFPLIEQVAQTGKAIILSTGLSAYNEILETRDFIYNIWKGSAIKSELAFLHCVSSYPTPIEQANLAAINRLKNLGCTVGYSDHTLGIDAAIISVALGARIVEKHFTIDKNLSEFRDHKLSADPEEFSLLVSRINETLSMLGSGSNDISEGERDGIVSYRRSIVAAVDLQQGTLIDREKITWLRPGGGLAPGKEDFLIGRKVKHDVKTGEMILIDDLE